MTHSVTFVLIVLLSMLVIASRYYIFHNAADTRYNIFDPGRQSPHGSIIILYLVIHHVLDFREFMKDNDRTDNIIVITEFKTGQL